VGILRFRVLWVKERHLKYFWKKRRAESMKNSEKKWWEILLFPHWAIKVVLVIASVILLIYSLGYKDANQIIAYSSYMISAYTLTVVSIKVPAYIEAVKKGLYKNKYSGRYLTDPILRAKISLYVSSAINIIYALSYLGGGIFYRSEWTIAIAIYYIVLSLIRFGLVRKERKRLLIEGKNERRRYELRSCYFCGAFMFLLNIAVTILVVQMIWKNKFYDYSGIMIYAQAAYAFYCFTRAIIHLVRYRRMEHPILSAAKVVSMVCALMSILSLQTAMLMQFGSENGAFIRIINIFTGSVVCFGTFAMAVWLVHRSKEELRLLKERAANE